MTEDRLDPRQQAEIFRAEAEQGGGVATEQVMAQGVSITLSLTNDGGYIGLNWNNTGAIGKRDYVALYDTTPTDPHGYLTRQWDWVKSASGVYQTGTKALGTQSPPYWIAYCGYDYATGEYVIVQQAGSFKP